MQDKTELSKAKAETQARLDEVLASQRLSQQQADFQRRLELQEIQSEFEEVSCVAALD